MGHVGRAVGTRLARASADAIGGVAAVAAEAVGVPQRVEGGVGREHFGRPTRTRLLKLSFLGCEKCMQENADFEHVFASILGRFWRVWECQK